MRGQRSRGCTRRPRSRKAGGEAATLQARDPFLCSVLLCRSSQVMSLPPSPAVVAPFSYYALPNELLARILTLAGKREG